MNRHAAFLLRLVDGLNTRYAWEHSVRLCRGALLPNRFLLTLPRATVEQYPADTVPSLWRRLGMAAEQVDVARARLPEAQFVHFGFEENEASCLYKVYLEFDGRAAPPGAPFLLHLAFKWDVADPARHVQSRYLWYPALSIPDIRDRLEDVYRASPESLDL